MFFSLVSAVAYLTATIRDCTCYVGDLIGAVGGLGAAWRLGKPGEKGVEAMVKGAGGALQYLARHAASVERGVVTVLPKLVPSRIAIQASWIMHGVTTMISTAYGYIATYHTQSVYTNNHPWEGAATEGTGAGIS